MLEPLRDFEAITLDQFLGLFAVDGVSFLHRCLSFYNTVVRERGAKIGVFVCSIGWAKMQW